MKNIGVVAGGVGEPFRYVELNPSPKCVLLREGAVVPKKGSSQAAGFDLCYCPLTPNRDLHIFAGTREVVHTGISIAVPPGYYGRIAPRSGHAVTYGLDVLAGVVDSDYRGEIKVVLLNTSQKGDEVSTAVFRTGDRIAQLVIEKIHEASEMEVVTSLDDTRRGEGGFGSTGK